MKPAAVIANGATVQYRKVGRGIIAGHACAGIRYDCSQHQGGGGQHRYAVQFLTGPYRGTTRDLWIRDSEVIDQPAAAAALDGCTCGGVGQASHRAGCPWAMTAPRAGRPWLAMGPADFDTAAPAAQLGLFGEDEARGQLTIGGQA